MQNKFILLSSILFFSSTFLNAQTEKEYLSFFNHFNPIESDLLHIYTDGPQEKSTYSPNSTYPFKGELIEPSTTFLLEELLEVDAPSNDFYAIGRYPINAQLEGLILRVYDQEILRNSIYNLIYNTQTNSIEQGISLAHDYQTEGGNGAEQSWLIGLGGDNFTDLLTRNYYEKYTPKEGSEELEHTHKERSYLVTVENLRFKHILVEDSRLQKKLEKEFAYDGPTQIPFIKEQTGKELLQLLKGGLVIPSEND